MFNTEIRKFAPAQILSPGTIPGFPIVRSSSFVVLRASIANELGLEGLPFTRSLVAAAAYIPDCIIEDTDRTAWNGVTYVRSPAWQVFIDGGFPADAFSSLEAALHYVKFTLSILRFGSDQHLATLGEQERALIEKQIVATALRNEQNEQALRRAAGE